MNNEPVYFLIKYYRDHFTCFARGVPIANISDLADFCIVRFYPSPSKDLTPQLVKLQRRWRQRRAYRRWAAHPVRLFYRENYGEFPRYLTLPLR